MDRVEPGCTFVPEVACCVAVIMAMALVPVIERAALAPIAAVERTIITVIEAIIIDVGIRRRRSVIGVVFSASSQTPGDSEDSGKGGKVKLHL
jgi:hypothetical protein